MGNWTASLADRLLVIYRWTPFPAVSGRILEKGGRCHITSNLYPFLGARPLLQPCVAEILQKGALQLDLNVASISASIFIPWAQGKCIASLQEDPAEDNLCVPCFYCATPMQGLELDLRFCDGKLDCFFCWSASPYLPLDPFSSRERPRSSKKGTGATSVQTFTFFQVLDPFSSPERPRSSNKGRCNLTAM